MWRYFLFKPEHRTESFCLCVCFVCLWWHWELNPQCHTCWASASPLSCIPSPTITYLWHWGEFLKDVSCFLIQALLLIRKSRPSVFRVIIEKCELTSVMLMIVCCLVVFLIFISLATILALVMNALFPVAFWLCLSLASVWSSPSSILCRSGF